MQTYIKFKSAVRDEMIRIKAEREEKNRRTRNDAKRRTSAASHQEPAPPLIFFCF